MFNFFFLGIYIDIFIYLFFFMEDGMWVLSVTGGRGVWMACVVCMEQFVVVCVVYGVVLV